MVTYANEFETASALWIRFYRDHSYDPTQNRSSLLELRFSILLSDEAPMMYEISSFTIQKGKADEQCLILCQCFVFFFLINTREN